MGVDDRASLGGRQQGDAGIDRLRVGVGRRVRSEPLLELAPTGPHQREERGESAQHLQGIRPARELALAVEAAALVLEPRAARTGRVAWDKRHRRHGRPFSGRRVRIRRRRGCRARTKERGTEMKAPPRRFAPSWGHEKTLSLGQHPRLLIQQEEGAGRPLPLLIRRERGSLAP